MLDYERLWHDLITDLRSDLNDWFGQHKTGLIDAGGDIPAEELIGYLEKLEADQQRELLDSRTFDAD